MATRSYTRAKPCESCGQQVTVVKIGSVSARPGQLVESPPTVGYRHTAVEYAGDRVDDECNLPAEYRA